MPRKKTNEQFIADARRVHGDKYDYSEVKYDGAKTPVKIICPKHGPFLQNPMEHLQGNGCQKCGVESRSILQSVPFEEFVRRAKAVHGDKYDYSIAEKEYHIRTFKTEKVTIICPVHGPFKQIPASHSNQKQGCPECGKTKTIEKNRMSMDEFLLRARQAHGWRYDYSKVDLEAPDRKITIICPVHGEFKQEISNHLSGQNCPDCANDKLYGAHLANFIQRAQDKFGDRFDYSEVRFGKGTRQEKDRKITIICREHGPFRTTANNHTRTPFGGCRECELAERKENFLRTARLIHGNKYDYSKVHYVNNSTKVEIICPVHGSFHQTPDSHRNGKGCRKCAIEYNARNRMLTRDEFVSRAVQANSPLLDFSETVYTGMNQNVTVRCIRHGYFTKAASSILYGIGCPVCSKENRSFMLRLLSDEEFLLSVPSNSLLEIITTKRLPKVFYDLIYTQHNTEARAGAIRRLKEDLERNTEETEVSIEENDLDSLPENNFLNEKAVAGANDAVEALGRQEAYQDRVSDFIQAEYLQTLWNEILNGRTDPGRITLKDDANKTARQLLDSFRREYSEVTSLQPDGDYRFPSEPTLLQKLIIKRSLERLSYANWSAMGSGKTLASLVAARLSGAKTLLVLAPKDVILQSWIPQIRQAYPDTLIFSNVDGATAKDKDVVPFREGELIPDPEGGRHRAILVNYDRFSYPELYEKNRLTLLEARPGFVCLDEIQYVKSSAIEDTSNRHSFTTDFIVKLRERNPLVRVHILSGTPVINNLEEPRSIIKILTGEEQSGSNRITVKNVHEAYRSILMNGFRFKPDDRRNTYVKTPEINGKDILQDIASLKTDEGVLAMERILAVKKINSAEVQAAIRPGTVIYTTYVDGIVEPVLETVRELGFRAEEYTGNNTDRTDTLDRFLKGETDVLVASRPIILGIDGLQERSDNMLVLSLPWTWADYEQLTARLDRPKKDGSRNKVSVIIPQVTIKGRNGLWSWDRRRLALLQKKRTLGEAVVEGYIEKVYSIDRNELLKNALQKANENLSQ